ncbi:MAG TPA: MFS transporter, partial [Xanthobacteraceae bacterium]|nr:MFS transporter [Xanthobacteraceae bacterium]
RYDRKKIIFLAQGLIAHAVAFLSETTATGTVTTPLILGAVFMLSVVIRQPLIQLETPDDMRGRVSAVNSLFIGTSNQIGEFKSGVTAEWFGTVPAVLIGGVGTVLVVLTWIKIFPSMYNVHTFEQRYRAH